MKLNDEERSTLIELYLKKCDDTLDDARIIRDQKRWNSTANRLYYALFNALNALFVSYGIAVGSHNGVKIRFGKEFVLKGLATTEEGKLLSQMESMRERADYDATFIADESVINERFTLVEQMIDHIKQLIALPHKI
mgnify:CR=1 FL=1